MKIKHKGYDTHTSMSAVLSNLLSNKITVNKKKSGISVKKWSGYVVGVLVSPGCGAGAEMSGQAKTKNYARSSAAMSTKTAVAAGKSDGHADGDALYACTNRIVSRAAGQKRRVGGTRRTGRLSSLPAGTRGSSRPAAR